MKNVVFPAVAFLLSGGLAAFGETLTVSGDTEIPAGGASYDGVVFTGGYTLSGGKISLSDENGGISVQSGDATIACEIDVGDGTERVPVSVAESASLTIAETVGALSGAAPIVMLDGGTVYNAGANTFSGDLFVSNVFFHARSDAAFGTADGRTVFLMNGGYIDKVYNRGVYFDGIETSEELEMSGRATSADQNASYLNMSDNVKNVFRGDCKGFFRVRFGQSAQVEFHGKVETGGFSTWHGERTATADFHGEVQSSRFNFQYVNFNWHHPVGGSNGWGDYGLLGHYNNVHCMHAANIFLTADGTLGSVKRILNMSAGAWILDLNGYDQVFSYIRGGGEVCTVRSTDKPALLRLENVITDADAEAQCVSSVKFEGQVSLQMEGPRPLTLTGRSATTGYISLKNGADLTLEAEATWGGTEISLSDDGTTLDIRNVTAFGEKKPRFTLGEGTRLSLSYTGSIAVDEIAVGETVYRAAGTYGAVGSGADHELAELAGSGALYIEAKQGITGVFSPDADDAAPSVAAVSNWTDGKKPDFVAGSDIARFAAAGDRAIVDTAVNLYGVEFAPPGGNYELAAAPAGTLTVGAGGISMPAAGSARVVTNAVPTAVAGSATWTFDGAEDSFWQAGALSGNALADLTVRNNADVHLAGDNSGYFGRISFVASEEIPGGVIHVHDGRAFGGAGAEFTMERPIGADGTVLDDMQVMTYGDLDVFADINMKTAKDNAKPRIVYHEGQKVTYHGKYMHESYLRDTMPVASHIVFAGGFDFKRGIFSAPINKDWYGAGDGALVLTNVSGNIGQMRLSCNSGAPIDKRSATVRIFTPTNVWSKDIYGMGLSGTVKIECFARGAIMTNRYDETYTSSWHPLFAYNTFETSKYLPVIDLGGFDQSVAGIREGEAAAGFSDETIDALDATCEIRSSSPAKLTAYQISDATVGALSFRGNAGFNVAGTKTLTMRRTASPTEGPLQVDGGRLVLEAGAFWTNAVSVTVKNSGSLTLNASSLLNRKGTVTLSEGGVLTLGAGTENRTKFLVVDGVSKPAGYYGSEDCTDGRVPDGNRLSAFSGAGVLYCRGIPGAILIIR